MATVAKLKRSDRAAGRMAVWLLILVIAVACGG